MAREILIIRNTPRENPGIIEDLLKENNLDYQIIDFNGSLKIQPVQNYGALIVLGGPESANDTSNKMLKEIALIRDAVLNKIPYLGICLGMQTLVKAMGGQIIKCQQAEAGFRDKNGEIFKVDLTEEGRNDRLFNRLPGSFRVFQLHGETVHITEGMHLLATGGTCRNQIVKVDRTAYGIQAHFELNDDLLESWITGDPDLKKLDALQLRTDFNLLKSDYLKTGQLLFTNFLKIAGLL
jgi:GMP synthase (glutamine-hydrolysing)